MRATIAWWDLSQSGQSIESLREHLRQDADVWTQVSGLRWKVWVSDATANCWGAVMLWESGADAAQPLPPNRATELIGYPPTHRLSTHVEALVEGLPSALTVETAETAEDTRRSD